MDRIFADLEKAYGVTCGPIAPVTEGLLNLKWKVTTEKGELLVKQYSAVRFGYGGCRLRTPEFGPVRKTPCFQDEKKRGVGVETPSFDGNEKELRRKWMALPRCKTMLAETRRPCCE